VALQALARQLETVILTNVELASAIRDLALLNRGNVIIMAKALRGVRMDTSAQDKAASQRARALSRQGMK
jgi:hypothetical protein